MTELSFENPEGGEPRAASDGKIRTALVRLKETINGELDHTNLTGSAGITDAQLASPNNGTHKLLLATSEFLSEEKAAATWFPSFTGVASSGGTLQSSLPIIYFAKEDFEVSGKTLKMRLRAQLACNATKPTIKFTFGLYPITVAGSANQVNITAGTVVSGSTVEANEPSASTITQKEGSDFTVPANGAYAIGVVTSAKLTANSAVVLISQLQIRSV